MNNRKKKERKINEDGIIVRRRGVVRRVPFIQSSGPDSIPGGSGILITVMGLGLCLLCSVLCCFRRWSWHSADYRFRDALHCVCLVFRSIVYAHLQDPTHSFTQECQSYIGEDTDEIRGNVIASHAAGRSSIPGRINFLVVFSSIVRQMSENFYRIRPRVSFGHHNNPSPDGDATVSDFRCNK